jgi:hypothetical protein
MHELSTDEIGRIVQGHCPDCGHRGFVLGPQGGLSINIECGNLECRSRFHATLYASAVVAGQRIEKRSQGGSAWESDPDEP